MRAAPSGRAGPRALFATTPRVTHAGIPAPGTATPRARQPPAPRPRPPPVQRGATCIRVPLRTTAGERAPSAQIVEVRCACCDAALLVDVDHRTTTTIVDAAAVRQTTAAEGARRGLGLGCTTQRRDPTPVPDIGVTPRGPAPAPYILRTPTLILRASANDDSPRRGTGHDGQAVNTSGHPSAAAAAHAERGAEHDAERYAERGKERYAEQDRERYAEQDGERDAARRAGVRAQPRPRVVGAVRPGGAGHWAAPATRAAQGRPPVVAAAPVRRPLAVHRDTVSMLEQGADAWGAEPHGTSLPSPPSAVRTPDPAVAPDAYAYRDVSSCAAGGASPETGGACHTATFPAPDAYGSVSGQGRAHPDAGLLPWWAIGGYAHENNYAHGGGYAHGNHYAHGDDYAQEGGYPHGGSFAHEGGYADGGGYAQKGGYADGGGYAQQGGYAQEDPCAYMPPLPEFDSMASPPTPAAAHGAAPEDVFVRSHGAAASCRATQTPLYGLGYMR